MKKFLTKILFICVIIFMLFNIINPIFSHANLITDMGEAYNNGLGDLYGGILLDPIRNSTLLALDGIMGFLNIAIAGKMINPPYRFTCRLC